MSAEFLSTLWLPEPLLGELRLIHDGEVKQQFHADPERAYESALGWDGLGWDAYFGVLNRVRESGKAEDCVANTGVLWADLDAKNIGGTHMAALMALQKADMAPSILVDSGHGLHCYWLLRAPVAFDRAAAAMKGIARQIGGDHVHDAPRVLRIPGTHNHKYGQEIPVRLLQFDPDRRYRFSDFDGYIEAPRAMSRPITPEGERQPYEELYPELRERIERGAGRGERSELIFSVCVSLLRRNWSDEQIIDLFMAHPEGIGAKIAEMNEQQAARYMHRTLERAREVME